MNAFTGMWRLLRLAIRRDRVKLAVILLVLTAIFASSVSATIDFYGKSQEDTVKYVMTAAPSVVSRVFSGPIGGANIGAVVLNETFVMMIIATSFTSTMAVVRHTRQNEEQGRSELIESGVTGRYASISAALITALIFNLLVAAMMAAVLIGYKLPVSGSLAAGAAVAATGMVFAGIAAVASQLADSARGANAYSALAIGAAFIVRAIGDVGGSLAPDGLSVSSSFLSWLSPFGWAQQIFPFNALRVWIFWLFAGLFIVAVATAVALMSKRDIGMGMISTRPGPAAAKPSLLSLFGLARRLQRGILRGWAIAIVVFSALFGITVKEFESFLAENEDMKAALSQFGTGNNYHDIFLAVLISMMAILISGYAVQALLRMRSEESGGQLESVLAGSASRYRWLLSHIGYIFGGVVVLLVLMSLSMGLSYMISVGASIGELWRIIGAAIVQGAAIVAFSGFVVAVFAVLPRAAVAVAWGGLAASLMIVQLGSLLKLPQWFMNISPFIHLPAMPASDFKLAPVIWLLAIGLGLLAGGLVWLGRRDIATG